MSVRPGFRPGSLAAAVAAVSSRALASGALLPIPTAHEFVEDGGVRFFVRVLTNLARKDEDRATRERRGAGRPENPFLPYEKDLFVAEVSDTHVAILNKYNVVERHLLVVTRRFEDQRELLTQSDFEALAACMAAYDSLGFYNGGVEAGASQPHKHLQIVPLPLAPSGPPVPIEPLLDFPSPRGRISTVPGLGFLHAFVRLDANPDGFGPNALEAQEAYRGMLSHLGLAPDAPRRKILQRGPYCLLVTRTWMLLVPRSRECFGPVSINSLGYAGALLVRDREQLRDLHEAGPFAMLRSVSLPCRTMP